MTHFRKIRFAALAALLLSGCEFVDAVEVAVYGPECGRSGELGYPAGLNEKTSAFIEQNRFDEATALLETYAGTQNPDVLFTLAYMYLGKVEEQPHDPERNQRIIDLLTHAALCGHGLAAEILSGFYGDGLSDIEGAARENFGIERNPELAACLHRAFEANVYNYFEVSGWVWGCGLRMEDFPE